eukprot:GGOE01002367.1.p1 GENE.GGOE01002367.1~~GGOE01002367.1.p1  ORF type:complete len:803 (+),score=180.99 GGOE01002367.1:48-2456(+)
MSAPTEGSSADDGGARGTPSRQSKESMDQGSACTQGAGYYLPPQGALFFPAESETERLMTGTEFTEMYQRDIAKLRSKPGGARVSFGEKLFGNLQHRRSARQKGSSSKPRASKEPFSITASPVKHTLHRRAESAPRSARHHVAGTAGTAMDRPATTFMMNGPGILLESYITHFDAKFRRRQIPQSLPEAEALYIQLLELKQRTADLEAENVGLRTVIRKREKEKAQVEKRVEELIANGTVLDNNALRSERANAEGQLIQNLRGKVRILETSLVASTEELNRLKLDGKYLRVRELETEVKAYYSEARRLQRILDQMTANRNKDSEKQAMDEALALLQDKEQVIVRLRDTIATLKQMLKQHRQELDRLQEEKERQRHEAERRVESLGGEGSEHRTMAQTCREELESLQVKLTATSQTVEEKDCQVARLTEQLKALKDNLQQLTRQHEALVSEQEQQLAHNRDLQEELNDLQQDLEEMKAKFHASQEKYNELHRQVRSGAGEADICRDQCDRMKDEFEAVTSERDALLKNCRRLQEDSDALKDQVKDLKAELEEEKAAHRRLQSRLNTSRSQQEEEVLQMRDDHHAELEEQQRTYTAEVEKLRKALQGEQRRRANLQQEVEQCRQGLMQRDDPRRTPLAVTAMLASAGVRRTSTQSDTSRSTDDYARPPAPKAEVTPAAAQAQGEDSDAGQAHTTSAEGDRPAFSELDDDGTDNSPRGVQVRGGIDRSDTTELPVEADNRGCRRSPSSHSSETPRTRSRSPSPDVEGHRRTPSPPPKSGGRLLPASREKKGLEDDNYSSDSAFEE